MTEEEKEPIREEIGEADKEAEHTKHEKRIQRIRLALVLMLAFFCIAPTAVSFWAIHRMGEMNEELETIERMLLQLPAAGNGGEGRISENMSSDGADIRVDKALNGADPAQMSAYDVEDIYSGDPAAFDGDIVAQEDEEAAVKRVYLSFDDGPSVYTDDILDILDTYGVKATFFVNGRNGFDDQYRRIVEDGHSIGMHSYSHVYDKVYKDLDSFAEDLYQIQRLIYDKTGVDCRLYRFPGGSSNQVHSMDMKRCIQYLNAKDIRYFDWNVSGGDALAGTHSAEEITQNVLQQVKKTDDDTLVVLLHDSATKRSTVDALPAILEGLQAMDGVEILPISDDTKCIQHIK